MYTEVGKASDYRENVLSKVNGHVALRTVWRKSVLGGRDMFCERALPSQAPVNTENGGAETPQVFLSEFCI